MVGSLLTLAAFLSGYGLRSLVRQMSVAPREMGLAEELLWGLPQENGWALLNVDGSLMAAWRLTCVDAMAASMGELEEVRRVVNRSICGLPEGWMLHYDVSRVEAPGYPGPGAFPGAVIAAVDEERRRRFGDRAANYVSEHVLVATFAPPREVYSRAKGFFIEGSGPTATASWREQYAGFEASADSFEGSMATAFGMERLDVSALASHLRRCLTGLEQRVAVPAAGVAVRDLVVAEDLVGGFRPRIGDREIRVVAVTGYPAAPGGGSSDFFHSLPFPVRSSSRLFPLSRAAGQQVINRMRLAWFNRGMKGKDSARVFGDDHAAEMASDAQGALRSIASGETLYAAYTWTMVLVDGSSEVVEQRAKELVKRLSAQGFSASIESVNAVAAFLGSLPGHGSHNVRLPLVSVRNFADLMMTTSPHLGAAHCPSSNYPAESAPVLVARTEDSMSYRLHLSHEDVPHGLVLGRTRSGKSILLQVLALQALRWPGSRVWFFDVDHSSAFACLAAGGRHYDIGGELGATVEFQPLARVDEEAERRWAVGWLMQILGLQGLSYESRHEKDLSAAVGLLGREARELRTLSYLRQLAQIPAVKDALAPYTGQGSHGELLDANRDGLHSGRLQVFELTHLLRAADARMTVPVLLYLFHRIERSLSGDIAHIFIDEAWLALLDPTFAAVIEGWLRRLAKMNCGVWLATQSPAEILEAPSAKVFLDSCPSRIYLPDAEAGLGEGLSLYRRLGLNATQIDLLSRAQSRRHYLHHTPRVSRLFELQLDPLALALMAPQPGKTVAEMYRLALDLEARDGQSWLGNFLGEVGLGEWAEVIRARGGEERAA